MKHSLTWIQLNEKEWLLICVNYNKSISLKDEQLLVSKKLWMQATGSVCSSSTYTWQSYRVWKDTELTNEDKNLIECLLEEKNYQMMP